VRLAVDLDGVTVNLMDGLRDCCMELYGVRPEYPTRWEFSECWGYLSPNFDEQAVWERFMKNGGYYGMCKHEGASVPTLKALEDEGWQCVFFTVRGTELDPVVKYGIADPVDVMHQTYDWLESNGLGDKLVVYDPLKIRHKFDVLLDDNPKFLATAAKAGRDVLMYQQPWNEEYIGVFLSVMNWNEVFDEVVGLPLGFPR